MKTVGRVCGNLLIFSGGLVLVVVGLVLWALVTLRRHEHTQHALNERVSNTMAQLPPAPQEPLSSQPALATQQQHAEPTSPPPEIDFATFWEGLYQHGANRQVVFTRAEAQALYKIAYPQKAPQGGQS